MIAWEVFYAFACGAMLMMSALGLESAIVTPSLDRQSKRFFIAFFAVIALGSAMFFLEVVAYLNPSLVVLEIAASYLQSLFFVAPFPMLAAYVLYCCGESCEKNPLFFSVLALFGVFFILLNVAAFVPPYFYVITPDNQLSLGFAYPLLIMPVLAMLILIIVGVIRRRGKLPQYYFRAFLICLIPVTLVVFVHMFTPIYVLVDVSLTIAAYSMYRIIVLGSIEQDLRLRQEIASQRDRIAVLQMRPHFIYNTMMSIYYLCDQDPQLAKQVTLDFTTYLRKNFTAIASEDTIPFSEELEHTRAYLAVEQAQFEDDLFVDYDTPHTQFRVPPLTLQPIVENSVKYGMDPDSGPLHIQIRTRETDAGNEIVVEDNGPGFDSGSNDEPHVALANIEQRLDMMCSGRLSITPREGGGTVVKVTIPQRR